MKIGVVMDPIDSITPYKDTTLALLLEASRRGWEICYLEMADLLVRNGVAMGRGRALEVFDDNDNWYSLAETARLSPLHELDAILMRKDPPFDTEYIYATYILERAEQAGCAVVNRPSALRNINEKMSITGFAELCAPTLVTRNRSDLKAFLEEHGDIVVKPLDGMGGSRIFRIKADDSNFSVITEVLTEHGDVYAMAQKFLPGISEGDKRVLVINGEPASHMLARIPAQGESRGNLAAGGRGEVRPIGDAEKTICARVAPFLREQGILFAGLDVIGDKLTEINVTSPTCVREVENASGVNVSGLILDAVAQRVAGS